MLPSHTPSLYCSCVLIDISLLKKIHYYLKYIEITTLVTLIDYYDI